MQLAVAEEIRIHFYIKQGKSRYICTVWTWRVTHALASVSDSAFWININRSEPKAFSKHTDNMCKKASHLPSLSTNNPLLVLARFVEAVVRIPIAWYSINAGHARLKNLAKTNTARGKFQWLHPLERIHRAITTKAEERSRTLTTQQKKTWPILVTYTNIRHWPIPVIQSSLDIISPAKISQTLNVLDHRTDGKPPCGSGNRVQFSRNKIQPSFWEAFCRFSPWPCFC